LAIASTITGLRFRGELPQEFKRRTPEERKATLKSEIKSNEAMLEYLRNEGTHPRCVSTSLRQRLHEFSEQ
jgi:hypothetical protein